MSGDSQTEIIALAIGLPLMLVGFYALKRANLSLAIRVLIGIVMLIAGVVLAYPLVTGDLSLHPVRLGVAVALLGLGINQIATPLRMAMGKAA